MSLFLPLILNKSIALAQTFIGKVVRISSGDTLAVIHDGRQQRVPLTPSGTMPL